jgi:hypothetical protein
MSELDADLYGGMHFPFLLYFLYQFFSLFIDLYGTEDLGPDLTTKTESQENSLAPQNHSPISTAELQVKNATVAPSSSRTTTLTSSPAPIASWSEPTPTAAQYKASPPTPNVPQQIPTYQESNNDDRGSARGNYHAVAVEERSVRPSEMKDEGWVNVSRLTNIPRSSVYCWVAVGGLTV